MTCTLCEDRKGIIYEDELVKIFHAGKSSKGHIRIAPKKHITRLDESSDTLTEHLFFCANYSSAILFELFGAHGTNIMMTDDGEHLHVDVIERRQDDGISFTWKPKKLTDPEMNSSLAKIKDAVIIGKAPEIEVVHDAGSKAAAEEKNASPGGMDKVNYLLKQLDRIP